MDIEIDRERITNKFKRNGHYLNKNSLELVVCHLQNSSNVNKRLDELVKKVNEMAMMEQVQINETNLKLVIELLTHKTETGKSFSSYDKFLEHLKKWAIFYTSPYESTDRFFVDKPDPSLFKFEPQDYMQMNQSRFKAIREYNQPKMKNLKGYHFIGILYEKYEAQGNRIMLQNQINQVQLVLKPDFAPDVFLIPGCAYIAEGDLKNKGLQLTVQKILLPSPLPQEKSSIFQDKLKLVCDSISMSKNSLNFTAQDFKAYEIIYNQKQNKGMPVFLFGNVKINHISMEKVKQIAQMYPFGASCIILMIEEGPHEEIDLKAFFEDKYPIYIVPHINSEGPRILPKVPILKNYYNAKVLTNPARLLVNGRQCILANYPVIRTLYSRNLSQRTQAGSVSAQEMAAKASQMVFSQHNIGIGYKNYWKQSRYLDVSAEDCVFVCDKACAQVNHSEGRGNLISVGDFQNNKGEFVFFMPLMSENSIQLCGLPE